MTNDSGSDHMPYDEMTEVLTRARQLDSTIEDAAVRVYVREMSEADALLDTIDLDGAPLSVSFTAIWPEEGAQ